MMEKIINQNTFDCSKDYLINQDVYKIDFKCNDEKIYLAIKNKLDAKYPNQFHIVFNGYSVEISYNTVNKGDTLKTLCRHLNIEEDETIVFGDSGNDVPMLQAFKHSCVVANANEHVKEVAEYIIDSNEEYAVTRTIEKIVNDQNVLL